MFLKLFTMSTVLHGQVNSTSVCLYEGCSQQTVRSAHYKCMQAYISDHMYSNKRTFLEDATP